MPLPEERPHRCAGWAEKEPFQQDGMFCLSSLSNELLFLKVYTDVRSLLPLKLSFSGLHVSDVRLALASGCSKVLCCTAASNGRDSFMSDITDINASWCPLHSLHCLTGPNLPQRMSMQEMPSVASMSPQVQPYETHRQSPLWYSITAT